MKNLIKFNFELTDTAHEMIKIIKTPEHVRN